MKEEAERVGREAIFLTPNDRGVATVGAGLHGRRVAHRPIKARVDG